MVLKVGGELHVHIQGQLGPRTSVAHPRTTVLALRTWCSPLHVSRSFVHSLVVYILLQLAVTLHCGQGHIVPCSSLGGVQCVAKEPDALNILMLSVHSVATPLAVKG
jgi:hypothetical protein